MRILAAVLSVLVIAFASPAMAQSGEPRLLVKHGDWSAYMFMENGNKVCYMISEPKTAKGNYTRGGKIYALVTHRPAGGTRDVFSYITGYTYKTASEANVDIDGRKFALFTQDETAWAPDAASDKALAGAIRDGAKMTVKGTSSRGTLTTDTFGLKGSSKAYQRITSECY